MSEINAVVAKDYRHVIQIRDGDTREDLLPYSFSHPKYKNSSFRFRKSDLKEMGILEGRRHVIARFTDRYVVDGEEITTSWREIVFRRHGYHWEEAFGDNSRQDITFIQISVCCDCGSFAIDGHSHTSLVEKFPNWPQVREIAQKLAFWQLEFENLGCYSEREGDINWDDFNGRGLSLAKHLKVILGARAIVAYQKPAEDPGWYHNHLIFLRM
ncbi:hypothetical protein OAJ77_00890 [Rhodospirillales bacterium]|nr:hypothetical protein [Rhodospirillales bacterium]